MFLFKLFSYLLEEQEIIYCFSILNWNRISCYNIYYQRNCLVILVTCGYESFHFSSYSYVLWVLFRLLTTRFFMNELSTLRSLSSMAPLFCLLFLLPSNLQISLLSRISFLIFITKSHFISYFHFLVDKLSILVAAALWVWREMLKNIFILFYL